MPIAAGTGATGTVTGFTEGEGESVGSGAGATLPLLAATSFVVPGSRGQARGAKSWIKPLVAEGPWATAPDVSGPLNQPGRATPAMASRRPAAATLPQSNARRATGWCGGKIAVGASPARAAGVARGWPAAILGSGSVAGVATNGRGTAAA